MSKIYECEKNMFLSECFSNTMEKLGLEGVLAGIKEKKFAPGYVSLLPTYLIDHGMRNEAEKVTEALREFYP
jgi:hypothetical protein